jgi:hypothetical protein
MLSMPGGARIKEGGNGTGRADIKRSPTNGVNALAVCRPNQTVSREKNYENRFITEIV